MSADQERFKLGMQRFAGHVTVVTSADGLGNRFGITATAVCALTAEPPTVVVCVNRQTRLGSMVEEAGVFCVNLLGVDHREVADAFAGLTPRVGPDRFSVGSWLTGSTGAPRLADASVSFDCTVETVIGRSSHSLLIGSVQTVTMGSEESGPLVYLARQFRYLPATAPNALTALLG